MDIGRVSLQELKTKDHNLQITKTSAGTSAQTAQKLTDTSEILDDAETNAQDTNGYPTVNKTKALKGSRIDIVA